MEVVTATARDIPRLTETLSAAFDADPVMSWCIRQDAKRPRAMRMCFDYMLRDSVRFGEVTRTADSEGCAIWLPPGKWIGAPSVFEVARALPNFVRWMGFGRVSRWLTMLRLEDEYRPDPPHFYLAFLGVAPPRQGKGYGSTLLAEKLRRLDAERLPAYLESSNIRNNPLYERSGFRVTAEILLPDGPKMWGMWREPAAP